MPEIFDEPVTFREAVKHLAQKKLMPTELDSAGLKQVDAGIRRQSFFSAETALEQYLEKAKGIVQDLVEPDLEPGAAFNPAKARSTLKDLIDELGYRPREGTEGTIKDLSSDGRINLLVKTNVQLAHGAGRFIQENADPGVVDLWPALELVRFEDRKEPRDWEERWSIAARSVGDVDAARVLEFEERMVALKSSPIWDALGDGAGGYEDTLGNPYPPFAFNSGMWTEEVSRDEAVEMGLIGEGEKAEPARFDLASLFAAA